MGTVKQTPTSQPGASRAELILAQLEKVLSSPFFAKADRLRRFLRLIVENELRPSTEALKETLIGIEVYGRPVDYDPKVEPIVRTEARRLRLKLGEYYGGPGMVDRVVITVPTGGYVPQFDIRPEAGPKVVTLPAPEASSAKGGGIARLRPAWRIASVILLLGSGAIVSWLWLGRTRTPFLGPEVPVTRLPGSETQPNVSPDGKYVAFVWSGPQGDCCIYIKNLESGELRQVTYGAGHDLFPSWSPDGRSIAFLRMFRDGQKQILLTSVSAALSGSGSMNEQHPVAVSHAAQPSWTDDPSLFSFSSGPAWSPDGKTLAISDQPGEGEPDSLYLVNVADGQKKRATTPGPGDVGDYFPAFSPDARTLAFVRVRSRRFISDIYAEHISSGALERITSDSRAVSGLTWASVHTLVFSSSEGGNSLLWRFRAEEGNRNRCLEPGSKCSTRRLPQVGAFWCTRKGSATPMCGVFQRNRQAGIASRRSS
jgi:hypothetical protein